MNNLPASSRFIRVCLLGLLGGLLSPAGVTRVGGVPGNAPNQPATTVSPANGAPGASMPHSLCVDVTDPNDDPLTVTFNGRVAGASSPLDFTIIALPDTQFGTAFGLLDDPGTTDANENATTQLFNRTFGRDDRYELFSVSGMDFIIFHLEFDPSDGTTRRAELAWMDDLLTNVYPARRAIISAHHGLDPNGSFSSQDQAVYDMVSDYQTLPNGKNGWLRILTFSPRSKSIRVQTYSPDLNRFIDNHADNTAWMARTALTLAYAMDAPFQTIGTANVASGGQACVSWAGLQAGQRYEWQVEITDGTSTTRGPVWDFRTGCSTSLDCDDGNACTTDSCQGSVCANTASAIPCPATIDVCAGGSCSNALGGACTSDGDCSDGDACTTDVCGSLATTNTAALSFNGSSQYVRTADTAPELGTSTFTIEAWLKWDGTTGAGTGTGAGGLSSAIPLVTKGRAEQDASNVDCNYFFGIDTATKKLAADFEEAMGACSGGDNPGAACTYRCSITTGTVCGVDSQCPAGETCSATNGCTGGGTCVGRAGLNHPIFGKTAFATTPTAPWVAGWNHVAVTYDGSCWTLYVNGIDDTDTTSPPIPAPQCPGVAPRSDNISPVGIASALTSGGTAAGFFGGQLDEVRIWNFARTQAEILATKNEQVGSGSGLLAAWAFNEGAGTTTADTAGTNNQGNLTGSPAWITGAANLVDLGPTACINTAINCSDANPCTLDVCTEGICANPSGPDGVVCDDANVCTQSDACAGGACSGTPQPNGTSCNDGIACTSSDQCSNGICGGTPGGSCDDGSPCTADSCGGTPANQTALAFDGTNDYVTFGNPAKLGLSQFTIETWFRRTGTGTADSTGTGGIASLIPLVTKGAAQAETPANLNANYILGINTAGNVLAADFEDTATGLNHPVSGTTPIVNGTWYHAAATYDGSTWRLYLNGNLEATLVVGAFTPESTSIQHAGLGTMLSSTGAASGFFLGTLDEARIWNYARSQLDIQNGRLRQITSQTGLVARWGLNDGGGTTAADSTVPASNGTLTNFATPATSWVAGAPSLSAVLCSYSAVSDGAACTDAIACTATDTCGGGSCAGVYAPVPGCCGSNADCNDGNWATVDTCTSGTCSNTLPTTCALTLDCDDANACTADACVTGNVSALSFDPASPSDYVTMGAAAGTGALGATTFTLETWFKRTATGTSVSTGAGGIPALIPLVTKGAGQAETPANLNANYIFGINTAGNVLAADFEDAATGLNHPISGTTPIVTGVWNHAAATYDGTTWRLYLNGNLEATLVVGAFTPESTSIQHFGLATTLTSTGTAAGFFAGLLDEVRVWNLARSLAQIQAAKDQELTSGTGLIGRWGLNENGGTTANDSTTPAQNGTLTNGPTWRPSDKARLGTCSRTPIAACCTTSAQCDDGNPCTTDSCTANTCAHTNNTASCNDGNACTYDDVCAAGTCGGATIACTNDACNTRACNGTNTCAVTPLTGNSCDDGSACTYDDVCTAGTCGGTAINCTSDACNTRTCNGGSTCTESPLTGNACDDGSACTYDDVCTAGACGGTTIVCTGDVCHASTCNGTNTCTVTPLTGNACDDGSACTYDDVCTAGTCGGTTITCTNDACNTRTCNGTNTCSVTPLTGNECDDESACTHDDVCTVGTCGGTANPPPTAIDDSVRLSKTPSNATITWDDLPGGYNVYRGANGPSGSWQYNHSCLANGLAGSSAQDTDTPLPGRFFYYLVSRVDACGESSVGTTSAGPERPNIYPCTVPGPDVDGDGVPDVYDNCWFVPNASQVNSDSDGVGDACDNCPFLSNTSQEDSDEDGQGDACD